MAKKRRKKLTAGQRRARRQNRDPLYNPGSILSGHGLSSAADQLVNREFKPKLGALDRESATATRQGTALSGNAAGYYRQIAEREAQSVAQQSALREQTRGNLRGIADRTQGQITEAQGQETARKGADAQLRGEGLGGTDQALTELAAARANASQSGQAFQSAGELQGANYEGLARSNKSARELRGGELLGQLANRLANTQGDIRKRRSETESLKGASRTKILTDLRQTQFENLATLKGLGIKEEDLAITAATKAADRRAKAKEHKSDQQFQAGQQDDQQSFTGGQNDLNRGVTERGQDKSGGGKGGAQGFDYGSGRTRDQRLKSRNLFDQSLSRLTQPSKGLGAPLSKLVKSNPKKWGPIAVRRMVAAGVPEDIALAAVRRTRGEPVGRALVEKIQRVYGFTVPPRKRRPIAKKKGSGQRGTGRPS